MEKLHRFGYHMSLSDIVPTNIKFSSKTLALSLSGLTSRYPFLRTGTAGRSVMGKSISYLAMGHGSNQVFYNASHHANEWITTPVLLKFSENLAKAYVSGEKIGGISAKQIFDTSTVYIMPMVNPDGVDLVTGDLSAGPFFDYACTIAKNYPHIPFPNGWKANIRGVDLNLQYDAGWEKARKIKFSQKFNTPAPRDYVGPAPLSEPESAAVYQFTKTHDFSLTMSYHSQGKVIYWKYLDFEPAHSYKIATEFSKLSGYDVEETPAVSGYAGYKDWFIQTSNRPGYTIEVGHGTSPLPISQFDEIYHDNETMLALGCIISATQYS